VSLDEIPIIIDENCPPGVFYLRDSYFPQREKFEWKVEPWRQLSDDLFRLKMLYSIPVSTWRGLVGGITGPTWAEERYSLRVQLRDWEVQLVICWLLWLCLYAVVL
jgi:hypothetical protein